MKFKMNMKLFAGLGFCLCTGAVLLFPGISRAKPEISGHNSVKWLSEAPDSELAKMRGRYVDGDRIVNFGVEMLTSWQTSSGDLIREGMKMAIKLNRARQLDFRPVMTITHQHEMPGNSSPVDNSQHAQVNGAGVENITGVSQSILVAGEENTINNDVKIDVRPEVGSASPASNPAEGNGQSITGGTETFHGESGTVSTYSMNSNGVGYEIVLPEGQGKVIQRIRSGNGLFQSAQVASSQNQIQNNIKITIGTSGTSGGTVNNFLNTLQNIRGLPQVGMY